MSFADEIAEKRKSIATDKAIQATHDQSINAIFTSGDSVVGATNELGKLLGKLDLSNFNNAQLQILTDLKDTLDVYNKQLANNSNDNKDSSAELLKAVKAIKVAPVVNLPEPKVVIKPPNITVESSPVDLSPFEKLFKKHLAASKVVPKIEVPLPPAPIVEVEDERVDMDSYKAQDIDNSNPNIQYVGFINQEGNWYIIENDVKGNRLRYVFGNDNYKEAFAQAAQYEYHLLDEAIDALSA